MTAACHRKEGATLYHVAHKNCLLYDGRRNGRFGVQVGTWNLGSLSENGEVCDELRRRMIDVCCL